MNAYLDEDVEMIDARVSDEEDSEEGIINNISFFFFSVFISISILQNKIETDSSDEDDDSDINTKSKGDSVNTQLAVGHKLDRSFVLKGNKIGVFKHTDDDKIEFTTNIEDISKPQGKKFNPSKVIFQLIVLKLYIHEDIYTFFFSFFCCR
jgi:hypothetical protein